MVYLVCRPRSVRKKRVDHSILEVDVKKKRGLLYFFGLVCSALICNLQGILKISIKKMGGLPSGVWFGEIIVYMFFSKQQV